VLREAFALLSQRCRELLSLLIADPPAGYTQISAALGMPVGSIGPTRARCLDALRRVPALAALISAETPGTADARGATSTADASRGGRRDD
jgi:hypothetical protein